MPHPNRSDFRVRRCLVQDAAWGGNSVQLWGSFNNWENVCQPAPSRSPTGARRRRKHRPRFNPHRIICRAWASRAQGIQMDRAPSGDFMLSLALVPGMYMVRRKLPPAPRTPLAPSCAQASSQASSSRHPLPLLVEERGAPLSPQPKLSGLVPRIEPWPPCDARRLTRSLKRRRRAPAVQVQSGQRGVAHLPARATDRRQVQQRQQLGT